MIAAAGTGVVFFVACTGASYAHWANFEYRTFDLAYYVQALWQLLHFRFDVSVEGVPLLGNHVEPIVFILAPFLLVFRHPIVLVVVQNAALAAMAPMGFSIGRRIGLGRDAAVLLASALLLTPATAYVGLHEFHPEALAAPCLLLVIDARRRNSIRRHWLGIIMLLACKENMALLVAAYATVHLFLERKRPLSELRRWYGWPLAVAIVWFVLCTKVITPALNSGAIDYLALYDRLGHSAGEILFNAFTQPQRWITALGQSLREGNLLSGLLLPFLALPLLRPRWLVVGLPILLQHLLSWRSSEWQIFFHYAAPLIPLFWIAMVESVARFERWKYLSNHAVRLAAPLLVLVACLVAQYFIGPAGPIASTLADWPSGKTERARKREFMAQIPDAASVMAPLPYLSHLAMRERLYSLHYVLKGLKTLGRSDYEPPPPPDFVLIDYNDSATFDPSAGYYHPAMKTVDARVIPSSDRLLHNLLRRATWTVDARDELTLFRKTTTAIVESSSKDFATAPEAALQIDPQTSLESITKSSDVLSPAGIEIATNWNFQDPRELFPWMLVRLTPLGSEGSILTIHRGLCAPERGAGTYREKWRMTARRIPAGEYAAEAIFLDYPRFLWARTPVASLGRISLGKLKVVGGE